MDFTDAIHALRRARDENASIGHEPVSWFLVDAALAALDAAQGEAVWQLSSASASDCWYDYDSEATAKAVAKASGWKGRDVRAVYLAPQAPPAAVPAGYVPDAVEEVEEHHHEDDCNCQQVGYSRGWNACRAAMLAANKENNND